MNQKRTRGKYSVGGCENCRRKHRKCDKTTPKCLRCRAAGLECSGFNADLSWVTTTQRSLRDGRKPTPKCLRNHEDNSQENTSTSISLPRITAPDIEDTIANVDSQLTHFEGHHEHVTATRPTSVSETQPPSLESDALGMTGDTINGINGSEQGHLSMFQHPAYTPDFLGNTESVLDWPDLFSVDYSLSDLLSPSFGNTHHDVPEPQNARSSIVPPLTAPYSDHTRPLWHSQDAASRSSRQDVSNIGLPCLEPQGPMKLESSQDDTQMLLKHTKDHCFPQLWSSPLGKKSPLETHLTAAVLTFASMTYLAPRQISHASFTNVLALLAISSKHLAAQIRNEDSDKSEHWNQYGESAYQKAKQHLDYSLSTEVSPKVAKYKDLIMAVSTIVSFSPTTDLPIDLDHLSNAPSRESQRTARPHLVRAPNFALVVFFYRRVYNVHPHILQDYSNNVMHALQEFERCCDREKQGGPGEPWPAFMAGCEAMTKEKRDYFENWFKRAFDQTGFTRLVTARKCMYQVWERQDRFVMGGDEMQRHWTWMDISKERNLYVLLC
ncbi:hypothetical protein FOCG_13404 [Fusarium oxysporum f. sp. radicis-lycopersici 26381]|nr:hypothetical protein FOCG_13404 [Fusarium oxysporum f. sp. radicis-lycopersici 26381]